MLYWSIYQFYLLTFICYFYFHFSIPVNIEEKLVGVLDFLTHYKAPLDGFDFP